MTSPNTFKVLQSGESRRDSTTRPWKFLEAEFPLDARVTPVEVLLSPLITLETAQQEMSVLLLNENSYFLKVEKDFYRCTKMDFMSIGNDSYIA
jgi:hypothetical protein